MVSSSNVMTCRFAAALAAIACLTLTGALRGQERPPVVESVDLAVPFPPAIVQTAGKPVLVYELHVTNLSAAEVVLSRLHVVTPRGPIAEYRGDDLERRLGRAGSRRRQERPHVIGPGLRAVAYLWIELAGASSLPAAVRHRLELDVVGQKGPVRTAVEGASVLVSGGKPLVLDPPLRGGPWTAIYDPQLVGGHRTAIYTVDGRARIPGRFAIDWIRLTPGGSLQKGTPRPPDWNGLGAEVLAVADATVAAAMDGMPDNTDPPAPDAPAITLANATGNYVALDLADGRFAFYEHLQQGSVRLRPGDRVRRGEVIGRLGNSGSSSMGPHLHFHVGDANSPLGAEGLPFVFTRFDQLGAFESLDALVGGARWREDAAAGVRTFERPGANAVVRFR